MTLSTKKTDLKKIKRAIPLFLMMLPGLVYLLINNYMPMFGLIIAFKNIDYSKGLLASPWVGFKNFEYLFKTRDAFIITRNTLLYNFGFIVIGTLVAIGVAILLNEIRSRFFSRFYQSVIVIPTLISMVIVSYLVMSMLNIDTGMMNKTILHLFGVGEISWYTEPKYWPYILTVVNLWKSVGLTSVIYFAAIIGIDRELYEAAALDGASKWQQVRMITVPLIMPVIMTLTLLAIGRIFYSDFGLFFQVPLNSGALMPTTNVIDTYVYRGLIQLNNIGMSSAAGAYQAIVGFILVLLANLTVRKINKDYALF